MSICVYSEQHLACARMRHTKISPRPHLCPHADHTLLLDSLGKSVNWRCDARPIAAEGLHVGAGDTDTGLRGLDGKNSNRICR